MLTILWGKVFNSPDSPRNVSYLEIQQCSSLWEKCSLYVVQECCSYEGPCSEPFYPCVGGGDGREGRKEIISLFQGWRKGLFLCSRLSEKTKASFQMQRMRTMARGRYSYVFMLLQIAFIYPFDTCGNWWYKCFENRHVEQIGSCSYDGWVNGVEKWTCWSASGI